MKKISIGLIVLLLSALTAFGQLRPGDPAALGMSPAGIAG